MKRDGAVLAVVVIAAIVGIATCDGYRLYVIAMVGLTAIVGIGLNVLIGLTGQISLGHVGFYAIGAYAVGILTTTASWSFWASLLAAGTITGAAGVLLAVPAPRVCGPYLAKVTIAFGFVVEQGAAEWSGLTGGWIGLSEISEPTLFGIEFCDRAIAHLVLALTVLANLLFGQLSVSTWGRAGGQRFGDRQRFDRSQSYHDPQRRVRQQPASLVASSHRPQTSLARIRSHSFSRSCFCS